VLGERLSQNRTFRKSSIHKKIKEKEVPHENVTFSIPKSLKKEFRDSLMGNEEGLTMNKIVEQLIRSYLGKD
jgi:hypothetical protein